MPAPSRTIVRSVTIALIAMTLVIAWLSTGKKAQPEREQAAGPQTPAPALSELTAPNDPSRGDAPPTLAGKTHIRPSAAELEQKRYERMKAEMTANLEKLKAAGLGNVHPNVRSLQQQLETLEADHAGKSLPAK